MDDVRLVFQKGKQAELFNYFFDDKDLSRKELRTLMCVSKTTLRDYSKENLHMKRSMFNKLCIKYPKIKEFETYVLKELPLTWGCKKGGFVRSGLIDDKISYCAKLREIKRLKNEKNLFALKKSVQMHPIIRKLIADGVDLHCILGACLLTDGSLCIKQNNYRISYCTTDQELEKIMLSLLNELSTAVPKVAYSKKGNQVRLSDKALGLKMLSLSPNYKTSPSWKLQSKANYLREPHPTLKFLLNCSTQTKIWAARFAFSADGSISVPKNSAPSLELACYHPTLAIEWKDFMKSLGFSCNVIRRNDSWCGLSGIRMQTKDAFEKFYELGGFIDGVKISRKSKRFYGMPKNTLLEKVLKSGQGGI